MKRLLYKGEPVVTFKMIDELHNKKEDSARRRFNSNIKYFEEGKHYYKPMEVCAFDELNEQIKSLIVNNGDRGIKRHALSVGTTILQKDQVLITQKGYLLLVKSFKDELAWKMQDALIDGYFDMKQILTGQQRIAYDQEIEALKIEFNQKTEALQLELIAKDRSLEVLKIRFHSTTGRICTENKDLTERLTRFESVDKNYIPMIDAYARYNNGVKMETFKHYLKKINWHTKTRIVDNKKITDVYIVGLEKEIARFIDQCVAVNASNGVYKHWAFNRLFVLKTFAL